MSDRHSKKRRRRDREKDDPDEGFARKSLVDYSKVADRHLDDSRYERQKAAQNPAPTPQNSGDKAQATTSTGGGQVKMSSQMDAVMRLMTGREERTISEKLADSNRPTWEQYKKDNEDKLDLVGVDQKKMEEYRRELDRERDKRLQRGTNHKRGDGGGGGDDSDDDGRSSKKRKKDRKREKHGSRKKSSRKKSHHHSNRKKSHYSDSESSSSRSYSDESSDESSDRHRHRRKKSSHRKSSRDKKSKKKSHRKSEKSKPEEGNGDDGYRLSSFFNKGSSGDESE